MEGVVTDISINRIGRMTAAILAASIELKAEDKIATSNGLKFTVKEVVPSSKMPGTRR